MGVMTHNAGDADLGLGVDYVKLEGGGETTPSPSRSYFCGVCDGEGNRGWCWWAKMVLVVLFVGLSGVVFFKWIGPFIMEKEIIPLIIWERETFSTTMLAFIVFGSLALFPLILLPSSPSMWVAGMALGYGYGFLLVIGAVSIGVSIPYLIGSLFSQKIHGWLERYPDKASLIKLAGDGDWLHQFRAVALIRISPFPYSIYNYCAVTTDVKYLPYLLGTLVGMVPEIVASLYTGIIIRTLADASHDRHSLSAPQIIFSVSGFCITVATTVIVALYASKRLKKLQD